MFQNLIPQPTDPGTAIKTVYRWIWWKIMGQLPPFASWIYQIQHGIRQFPLVPCAVAHSLIQRGNLFPLFICQVAWIWLSSFCFHTTILPQPYPLVNTSSYYNSNVCSCQALPKKIFEGGGQAVSDGTNAKEKLPQGPAHRGSLAEACTLLHWCKCRVKVMYKSVHAWCFPRRGS